MSWLAIDIGGANLKAADGQGWARSVPFQLWRDPDGLATAIGALVASAPMTQRIAVTMTGELCDAFRTKADGVKHIIAAVSQAGGDREVFVYLVDGRFVTPAEAARLPLLAAASNWHVLARFACRFVPRDGGLLIDIGSTTTDIVLLADGQPRPRGLNDTDRLLAGELVYSGVGRTPICAVTSWLPLGEARCPVAAEVFATTADAYVTLGELLEQPNCTSTADGRPLTKAFSRERLARMICADSTTFNSADALQAAASVRAAQIASIRGDLQQVVSEMVRRPTCIVLSGAGEFLARKVISDLSPPAAVISLAEKIGGDASECGPAHALAVIAPEMVE